MKIITYPNADGIISEAGKIIGQGVSPNSVIVDVESLNILPQTAARLKPDGTVEIIANWLGSGPWYDQKATTANRLTPIEITEYGVTPSADWEMTPRPETPAEIAAREAAEASALEAKAALEAQKLSISRRQCAKQMRVMGIITPEESLAMITTATPPSLVETMIKSLPQDQQISFREDFAADTYLRNNIVLVNLMTATGASSKEIDDFFRAAVLL